MTRLREYLRSLADGDTTLSREPFGDELRQVWEKVAARTDALRPELAAAEFRSMTFSDHRVDADLVTENGDRWSGVCIVEPEPPHRILALRFEKEPNRSSAVGGAAIVLSGTSSSGKTSLAGALQEVLDGPWMHLDRDAILQRMPRRYHPFPATWGPVVSGFYAAAAALVKEGNLVIVDTLFATEKEARLCRSHFDGAMAFFVSVKCAPEVATAREAGRLNRAAGLAAAQAELRVPFDYDGEVETSEATPEDAATSLVQTMADFLRALEAPGTRE